MEMDSNLNILLVKEVKKCPLLYETNCVGRSSATQMDKLKEWQKIADKLNVGVHVAKRRYRALRDRYVKEKHNGPISKKPWPLFEEFHEFLAGHTSTRKSKTPSESTETQTKDSKEISNQKQVDDKNEKPNPEVMEIKYEYWPDIEENTTPIAQSSSQPSETYFDSRQDEDTLFVLSILPAIKRMPRNTKNRAKLEIQKIICQYDIQD